MSEPLEIDFNQEPRKNFLNLLVKNIALIEHTIFYLGRPLSGVRPMRGLIDSLDAKSKQKLAETHSKLFSIEQQPGSATMKEIEGLYRTILDYLHETYLKEFSVKPRYKSKKALSVE